jgi:enamine deaminase RidA (YjgF/YER057c/UK114 family)
MSFADVIKATIYTTDVDALLGAYGAEIQPIQGSNLPASTLIGVNRLAFPELKVEIEVIAAR